MKEVPMKGTPSDDKVEFQQLSGSDCMAAVYKGFWYYPCEGGYKFGSIDNYSVQRECYDIPREIAGKPVVAIMYSDAIFPTNDKYPQKIIIPDSVVEIEPYVIKALSARKKLDLTVDPNNSVFKVIDGNLCSKDGKTLIAGIGKGADDEVFVVPNGITTIGAFALNYGTYAGIIVPLSVQRIAKERTKRYDDLAFPYYRWDRPGKTREFRYNIYYKGTKEDWKKIDKDEMITINVKDRKSAIKLYFYDENPGKNTWHYAADGVTPEITHAEEGVISKLFKLFKKG